MGTISETTTPVLAQPIKNSVLTKDVTCPHEDEFHGWRAIHTEVFPMKVQEAYKLVFTYENRKFMVDVLAGRKISKYEAGQWEQDGSTPGATKRVLTYFMTLSGIGVKSSNITETQVLSPLSRAGETYAVKSEIQNEGIPYADSFTIMLHLCLQRAAPPADTQGVTSAEWARYSCYANINYKKTLWAVVKGPLERSTYGGMENIHGDVGKALTQHALAVATSGDPKQSRLGGTHLRKKRKTKSASVDLTHKIKTYRKNRDDSESNSGNWCAFVINLSLILMSLGLIGLNVFLYLKVLDMEGISSMVKKNSRVDDDILRGNGVKFGSSLLQDKNIGIGGSWLAVARVLGKQEELYHQEMEDMKQHIMKASMALQQADEELHLMVERMPKAMELLSNVIRDNEVLKVPPDDAAAQPSFEELTREL